MSYQALYRKWRPETFDKVVGQDAVMTTLKNQVSSGRIGHAYLFCGTRGTGKTSAAKIMARAVNCPHAAEHGGNPCNECETCMSIKNGTSMNVFEIDAASNNGVDNIRDIRDEVEYPPVSGKYKVYIIDEVHMLSPGAFNALLKTLEEPPSYVIFILATTDPQKIPATILSRCQRYDFRRMSRKTAALHLKEIAAGESMDIEDKAISYIAEAADGSMRDALSILDRCMSYHYGERLTYGNVLEILGAADTAVFSRLFGQIVSGNAEASLQTVNDLINSGADIIQLINDFIWYLRNVLLSGSIKPGQEDILDISADKFEQAQRDARLCGRRELIYMLGALAELVNRARFSAQKRVLFEVEIIRLCTRKQRNSQETGSGEYSREAEQKYRNDAASSSVGISSPGGAALQRGGTASDGEGTAQYGGTASENCGRQAYGTETSENDYTRAYGETAAKNGNARAYRDTAADSTDTAPENVGTAADNINTVSDNILLASGSGIIQDNADAGKAVSAQPCAGTSSPGSGRSADEITDILRAHWAELVGKLMPSNRPLFSGALLKKENGNIVIVFKNNMNYKLASRNIEENGVLKLRDLAYELTGEQVKMVARIARPGEIGQNDNKATDEELSRINFHIDIEG